VRSSRSAGAARLELLDQRFLPDKTVYVTCRTGEQSREAIATW